MVDLKRLSACLAAALMIGAFAGNMAMAGEHAIAIDMTDNNDEAWESIAMTNDDTVETGIVIHASAKEESEVVGFLYRGGGAHVLYKDKEWTEIESGDIKGYVMNDYLTYGTECKGLAEHYGVYGVRASWDDISVFDDETADSKIIAKANDGDTFRLVGKNGHWMQVVADKGTSAFISEEDVSLVIVIDSAIGLDEEDDGSDSVFTILPATGHVAEADEESNADGEEAASSEQTYAQTASGTTAQSTQQSTGTQTASTQTTQQSTSTQTTAASSNSEYNENDDDEDDEDVEDTGEDTYADEAADDDSGDDGSDDEEEVYEEEEVKEDTSTSSYAAQAEISTSGTASELQAQANALYQTYLDAQAAADAAVANGSGEQAIKDTAAAAQSAYGTFVKAQNLADQAKWGATDTSVSSASSAETSSQETYEEAAQDTYYEEPAAQQNETEAASQASSSDLELLAALIYCEAGNQPYEGQVAVGAVVMNRVNSGSFPGTIKDVIYQSGQFTPAYSGALASALANGSGANYTGAASEAMAGSDPTGGALYFNVHQGTGIKIGAHWFF